MSVIAVRIYPNFYEMAADSITVRGWTKTVNNGNGTKLFEENEVVIGSSGLARDSGLLRLFLKTRRPAAAEEGSIIEFFSEFADWMKKRTDVYGTENDFIVGFMGKVFHFREFFVEEIVSFEAIGAGMDYALGALQNGASASGAVEAAIELSCFCAPPVQKIEKILGGGAVR